MNTKFFLSGLALSLLTACSSGSSGGGSGGGGGGLTPGAGYANSSLTITVDGEDITTGATLLADDYGNSTFRNDELDLTLTTTSVADQYLVTLNGQQFTLSKTSDPSGRVYAGSVGTTDIEFVLNFDSDRKQLIAGAFLIEDPSNNIDYVGTGVFGFPTDPAVFDAITSVNGSGSATYEGQGNITVKAIDGTQDYYGGFGDAVLTVDFANKTIGGSIDDITRTANSDARNQLIGTTSATVSQTSITDAEFSGNITLDNPVAFGLSDAGTITYQGKFYETAGTGVGAYILGNDADASGTPAVVSGAIVAEQCPAPLGAC